MEKGFIPEQKNEPSSSHRFVSGALVGRAGQIGDTVRLREQTLPLGQRRAAEDTGLVLRLLIGWRDNGEDVQRDHVSAFSLP